MRPTPTYWVKSLVLLALLLAAFGSVGASAKSFKHNAVVAFLAHAELQAETNSQRQEISKALGDLLHKSPSDLRDSRYADYEGHAGAWSITELLRHYFVPNPPMKLEDKDFFADVSAPAARASIRKQQNAVTHSLSQNSNF